MKTLTIFITLGILLLNSGCMSDNQSEPLKQKVATALNLARTSLLAEKKVAVDVLWVLTQIQNKQHDATIDEFIQKMKIHARNPSYLPGVFPSRPKITLPESIQPGIRRFFTYVEVPRGQPEETAIRHLKQFISEDACEYILTHQFIVLLLAEQAGFSISLEMKKTKRHLLTKIYREQTKANVMDCIDLYMERVALILFFGDKKGADQQTIDTWINTIVEIQLPDGSWPLSTNIISYDNEKTSISSPRSHTTVLAIMALQAYLNDY